MLIFLFKIVGALSAYGKPSQIASAVAFGALLAFIPGGTLLWFLIFIPMFFVRINQAALLGSMGIIRLFASFYDPISEKIGYWLLTKPFLSEPMGHLLSVPGTGWLRLDDSFVSGGLVSGLLLWPVFYIFGLFSVFLFRKFLSGKIKKIFSSAGSKAPWFSRIVKAFNSARAVI